MTHVTYRLTGKNRDQLQNPALGNRVLATFSSMCFFCCREREREEYRRRDRSRSDEVRRSREGDRRDYERERERVRSSRDSERDRQDRSRDRSRDRERTDKRRERDDRHHSKRLLAGDTRTLVTVNFSSSYQKCHNLLCFVTVGWVLEEEHPACKN